MASTLAPLTSRITEQVPVPTSKAPPFRIHDLPEDCVTQIFSNLNWSELHKMRVNRSMKNCVLEATHFNALIPLKNFIGRLIENLDPRFSEQKILIKRILETIKISDPFSSLPLLHRHISSVRLNVRVQLISILTTLDVDAIKLLEHHMKDHQYLCKFVDTRHYLEDSTPPPQSMKDIFEAARKLSTIEPEIIQAIADHNSESLLDSIKTLLWAGDFDRAIALAQQQHSRIVGSNVDFDIIRALINHGDFERAIEHTEIMLDAHKSRALQLISGGLSRVGNTDRALEVAMMICSEDYRALAFNSICISLKEAGNMEKAIEVAAMIQKLDSDVSPLFQKHFSPFEKLYALRDQARSRI